MSLWEGGNLTTVYNYISIGAFLPINPSATTLCVCHSGFLIVFEYFPDDWCINQQKFPQIVHAVKYRTFWCLYVSNLDLLACWTTLNITFTVSPSILTIIVSQVRSIWTFVQLQMSAIVVYSHGNSWEALVLISISYQTSNLLANSTSCILV